MPRRRSLRSVTRGGNRREELEALAYKLAQSIDACDGRGMAALCKEYRETISAIAALTEPDTSQDPIARMVDAHRKKKPDTPNLRAV